MLQTKIINKKLQVKHPFLAGFAEGFTDIALITGLIVVGVGYVIIGKNVINKK